MSPIGDWDKDFKAVKSKAKGATMEVYFGYQFQDFSRNEYLEGLLERMVKANVITLSGASYFRGLK